MSRPLAFLSVSLPQRLVPVWVCSEHNNPLHVINSHKTGVRTSPRSKRSEGGGGKDTSPVREEHEVLSRSADRGRGYWIYSWQLLRLAANGLTSALSAQCRCMHVREKKPRDDKKWDFFSFVWIFFSGKLISKHKSAHSLPPQKELWKVGSCYVSPFTVTLLSAPVEKTHTGRSAGFSDSLGCTRFCVHSSLFLKSCSLWRHALDTGGSQNSHFLYLHYTQLLWKTRHFSATNTRIWKLIMVQKANTEFLH